MAVSKLKRQQAIGLEGKELYSSYANLGEFLVRGNLWSMMGGDADARRGVEEGRDFLKKSIAVNPMAHFGREDWQVVAVNALLDAGARPESIQQCDLIGNRLDVVIEIPKKLRTYDLYENQAAFGRPYLYCWADSLYYGDQVSARRSGSNRRGSACPPAEVHLPSGERQSPPADGGAQRGRRAPFDEPAVAHRRRAPGVRPWIRIWALVSARSCSGSASATWPGIATSGRLEPYGRPVLADAGGAGVPAPQPLLAPPAAHRGVASAGGGRRNCGRNSSPELAFGEAYQRDYQAYDGAKIQAGANLGDPNISSTSSTPGGRRSRPRSGRRSGTPGERHGLADRGRLPRLLGVGPAYRRGVRAADGPGHRWLSAVAPGRRGVTEVTPATVTSGSDRFAASSARCRSPAAGHPPWRTASCRRLATIRAASTGPLPGSRSMSAAVAMFRSMSWSGTFGFCTV